MCTNIDETSNSKRKALELITNIFRKKSKECLKNWNETENYPPAPIMNTPSEPTDVAASIVDSRKEESSPSFYVSEFGIPPHSPVSPRVKNINEDMEALTLSRQDNPFIVSKLEKLSASEELLSSSSSLTIQQEDNNISTPTTSSNDYYHQHFSPSNKTGSSSFINPSLHNLEIEEITQDDSNLHQHLIRSPPPQFPTKLSHFVFPLPNSPMRNISSRYGAFLSPDHRSESKSDYRSGSINLSTKTLADKLTFQSTHSLSIKSPPKIFNTYRKNSMGHIGDKLINQSSSSYSSSSSSSSTSDNIARRAQHVSSESSKKDLTKIPKTSGQPSNETVKNTDHHSSINDLKSSSNLTSNKEHCNNVIDYLKGKITGNGSKEDEDSLKDNEDDSNNDNPSCNWNLSENVLSNSREALISTQSSLLDASN